MRVLLVEDHAIFRELFASVFEREPGFEVVGQAGSLTEARRLLGNLGEEGVDLALVDLRLPDGDGTDLICELRYRNPHGGALVLTASLDLGIYARAVAAGAAGVLHKSVSVEEVMDAVRRLAAGEPLLAPREVIELLRLAGQRREEEHEARRIADRLTPREREVLQALAEGPGDEEIAERLHLSVRTARTHMVNILAKLGVESRLQALIFALRHGIARLD